MIRKAQISGVLFLLSLLHPNVEAQNFSEVIKVVASDRDYVDWFGWSVSISDNFAIVGALLDTDDSTGGDAGAAYIFEIDNGGNWIEVQKILSSDREKFDKFGCSVSISGNYAIIGAFAENEDASGGNTIGDTGSAYIFKRDSTGNWAEVLRRWGPYFIGGGAIFLASLVAVVTLLPRGEWWVVEGDRGRARMAGILFEVIQISAPVDENFKPESSSRQSSRARQSPSSTTPARSSGSCRKPTSSA